MEVNIEDLYVVFGLAWQDQSCGLSYKATDGCNHSNVNSAIFFD